MSRPNSISPWLLAAVALTACGLDYSHLAVCPGTTNLPTSYPGNVCPTYCPGTTNPASSYPGGVCPTTPGYCPGTSTPPSSYPGGVCPNTTYCPGTTTPATAYPGGICPGGNTMYCPGTTTPRSAYPGGICPNTYYCPGTTTPPSAYPGGLCPNLTYCPGTMSPPSAFPGGMCPMPYIGPPKDPNSGPYGYWDPYAYPAPYTARWPGATQTGTVYQDEEDRWYTPTLPPGRYLVSLVGDGDADLYVKIGKVATTYDFDCSPYLDGSFEACQVTLFVSTKIYVTVVGWAPVSRYTLTAYEN